MTFSQKQFFSNPKIKTVAIACLALLLGVVLYILDRPHDRVYFLDEWFEKEGMLDNQSDGLGQYFGNLGQYLPTFLHTYAFILLTMVVVFPHKKFKKNIIWICLFWFILESLFEVAQIDAIANSLAQGFPTAFNNIPFIENIPNYFIYGTFDVLDLVSIAVGASFAYLTIYFITQEECSNE